PSARERTRRVCRVGSTGVSGALVGWRFQALFLGGAPPYQRLSGVPTPAVRGAVHIASRICHQHSSIIIGGVVCRFTLSALMSIASRELNWSTFTIPVRR